MLTDKWDSFAARMTSVAREVLGTPKKKQRDWFDEQRTAIQAMLSEKSKCHEVVLQKRNPNQQK